MQSGPSSRRSSVDSSAYTSMCPKAIWNELRDRLWIRHRRSSAWENARHECSDYFITTASDRVREQQRDQNEKDHKKVKCCERARRNSEQRPQPSTSSAPAVRRRLSDWGTCFDRVQQSSDKSSSVRSDRPLVSGYVSELELVSRSGSTSPCGVQPHPLTRPEVGQQQLDPICMQLYDPALPTSSTCLSHEAFAKRQALNSHRQIPARPNQRAWELWRWSLSSWSTDLWKRCWKRARKLASHEMLVRIVQSKFLSKWN